jgi:hypothetical protein
VPTQPYSASSKRERTTLCRRSFRNLSPPPRSAEDLDNIGAWKKACEYAAFRSKAEGLAHRHLQNEARFAGNAPWI